MVKWLLEGGKFDPRFVSYEPPDAFKRHGEVPQKAV
jgi:hypothetical protein